MNKTLFRESSEQITVDIERLSAMLSCGRATARKVGEQAEIEASEQGAQRLPGQKYLEHQLSWFGKQYCVENDITLCGKTKAEALFADFLDSYVERKMRINKAEKEQFRKESRADI